MAKTSSQAQADPKQLEEAQKFWNSFTKLAKYCCIAVAVALVLMALFLL